jgi:hypothetical protein
VKLSSISLKIKTINDVLYVHCFMKKMLLVRIIADKGHTIVFNSNKCLIIQNKDPQKLTIKIRNAFYQVI